MNNTKALTQLGFVTARGLDNGELGALLLSNKVGVLLVLFKIKLFIHSIKNFLGLVEQNESGL